MKFPRTKLVIVSMASIIFFASCLSLLPTSTPPFQAWEGEPRTAAETAIFTYMGTGGYGLILYAIDGQPRTRIGDSRLLEGAYSNTLMCGFDVEVLPGKHSFEFYTVDTNPLEIFTLTFALEPGKTYTLEGSSKAFSVTTGGEQVSFVRKDVPAIVEPAETAPHATLEFAREGGAMGENAWVFRIDGKIRTPMYKMHPRWVVMNYSGLASGIVNSIGGSGMLIQANLEGTEGSLEVRLSPGKHLIEGFAETMFLGSRIRGDAVRVLEFDFKSGKAYKIVLVRDTEVNKNAGLAENGIKIVPK